MRTVPGTRRPWAAAVEPPQLPPSSLFGRLARTAVFTGAGFGLAVVAHRLAGGTVSTGLMGAALAFLAVLGWLLSRRERSGLVLTAALVPSQILLHLAFVAPAVLPLLHARGGARSPSTAALAALLFCHHGTHPITAAQVHTAVRGTDLAHYVSPVPTVSLGAVLTTAVPMLLAHLAAAALMAWWLRIGERACWRRVRAVVTRLCPPQLRPIAIRERAVVIRTRTVVCAVDVLASISGRGPPRVAGLPPTA